MDKFAPQSAIHLYVFEEQHAGNSTFIQLFNGDFSCHVFLQLQLLQLQSDLQHEQVIAAT